METPETSLAGTPIIRNQYFIHQESFEPKTVDLSLLYYYRYFFALPKLLLKLKLFVRPWMLQ